MKKIFSKLIGYVLLALFLPFKGIVQRRQKRLKALYASNPADVSDIDAHTILPDIIWENYYKGNYDTAKIYADNLLRINSALDKFWNTGNAIHHAHTVIGLISLARGNIESAKNHLLKSFKTSGSPQLNTFGPKLSLAKGLYEHGEDEVVIKFLSGCSKFWRMDNGHIEKWINDINEGRTPNFCNIEHNKSSNLTGAENAPSS